MRYGPKPNPRDPRAIGQCDRCAKVTWRHWLKRQMIQVADAVRWSGLLVCERCLDIPNPQERVVHLKPDPVPVRNPRPVTDGPTVPQAVWPPASGNSGGSGSF